MAASTTMKVTKSLNAIAVQHIFGRGDGLIVRHQGVEHGAIELRNNNFVTIKGEVLKASDCTVRKGVVDAVMKDVEWVKLAS